MGPTTSVAGLTGLADASESFKYPYDYGDAQKIKGLKSAEIMRVLGAAGRDEIIHRDDLVMMTGEK